jgi:hypothetical protein
MFRKKIFITIVITVGICTLLLTKHIVGQETRKDEQDGTEYTYFDPLGGFPVGIKFLQLKNGNDFSPVSVNIKVTKGVRAYSISNSQQDIVKSIKNATKIWNAVDSKFKFVNPPDDASSDVDDQRATFYYNFRETNQDKCAAGGDNTVTVLMISLGVDFMGNPGVTKIRKLTMGNKTYIQCALLVINKDFIDRKTRNGLWNIERQGDADDAFDLTRNTTHELGHTLHLGHIESILLPDNKNTIMHPQINRGLKEITTLTNDGANLGIKRIYGTMGCNPQNPYYTVLASVTGIESLRNVHDNIIEPWTKQQDFSSMNSIVQAVNESTEEFLGIIKSDRTLVAEMNSLIVKNLDVIESQTTTNAKIIPVYTIREIEAFLNKVAYRGSSKLRYNVSVINSVLGRLENKTLRAALNGLTSDTQYSQSSQKQFSLQDRLWSYQDLSPVVRVSPNPVTEQTSFTYILPDETHVRMTVVDSHGRIVTVLANGIQSPGKHDIHFDASRLSSGSYTCMLQTLTDKVISKFVIQH